MALSKSANFAHAQRVVPCNVCEDEVPGEYFCIECNHTLCPPCEKLHRKFTKGHNVVLRTQVGDIDTTILTCTDHGDQASFHCEKCNIPVCTKCVTRKHQGHKMVDLTEVSERKKKFLQNDVNEMQKELLPKLKKQRDEVNTRKAKYNERIQIITKEIEDENQTLHMELDLLFSRQMEKLALIRETDESIFANRSEVTEKNIERVEQVISNYNKVIATTSLSFVTNFQPVEKPLLETHNLSDLPEPPTFVPFDVHSMDKSLWKLRISSVAKPLELIPPQIVSTFKSPLKGNPSICITNNGDVWLGGSDSEKLVMVDIKGKVLKEKKIFIKPSSLAVLDCGDVIMSHLESRSVTRLLNNGKQQHIFDASPSYGNGVSVNRDQKVLICTIDGRVMRINSDGTNIKRIYKGSSNFFAVYAVESLDGNIYITNPKRPEVLIINENGKVLSTIKHTSNGKAIKQPACLVMDKMGYMLCSDILNDCVYILDQNQQARELVGRAYGIQKPDELDVDRENNLWITQKDGTVIVVKYLSA
ncbi:hypothetical protein FSP39_020776 [Pinctada imbricata]|uniref:B box-type domain-containing protein n=1 Tax=Pinctada imbricata TaxID=66713 RepID=A0AA88XG46_PINIB|nr:hypothetical protein FSP39_020776 [Pinctada imbricata]